MVYIKKGFYLHNRNCRICKNDFKGRKTQFLCSKECRKKYYGVQGYGEHKIASGTVGAVQELRVSIDLMLKGYEVFRAVSPSCSCDLLAMKNKKMYRFEVKTGYRNFKGDVYFPTKNIRAEYLVVALKNELIYRPELP